MNIIKYGVVGVYQEIRKTDIILFVYSKKTSELFRINIEIPIKKFRNLLKRIKDDEKFIKFDDRVTCRIIDGYYQLYYQGSEFNFELEVLNKI